MAATALNIVWRNRLPNWARRVEQAAGSLELVKTSEPQHRQRSIGSFVFCCSRPRIGVANLLRALKVFVQTRRNCRAHARGPRERAAFNSSAVAVNCGGFLREMHQIRGQHDESEQS